MTRKRHLLTPLLFCSAVAAARGVEKDLGHGVKLKQMAQVQLQKTLCHRRSTRESLAVPHLGVDAVKRFHVNSCHLHMFCSGPGTTTKSMSKCIKFMHRLTFN